MKTKDEIAAYMKRYQEKNKEYLRRYKKAYYAKNRDEINARWRTKYALDPEFRRHELERQKNRRKKQEESK